MSRRISLWAGAKEKKSEPKLSGDASKEKAKVSSLQRRDLTKASSPEHLEHTVLAKSSIQKGVDLFSLRSDGLLSLLRDQRKLRPDEENLSNCSFAIWKVGGIVGLSEVSADEVEERLRGQDAKQTVDRRRKTRRTPQHHSEMSSLFPCFVWMYLRFSIRCQGS